ncbi:hypothetical protein [Chitinophaga solisilvae]|uniref:Uncharacterized protein n=1 Tax=Chitinophaga solisilvae TaxID=1233460 RepID=A0A433WEV3_9BACT|nr:hypothetical protein [Chitinophaga solisilvae]NSL89523.1 hypothetical protein [Chitinophaga solisilvae]
MKYSLLCLFACCLYFTAAHTAAGQLTTLSPASPDSLPGTYTGKFGSTPIFIHLHHPDGNKVTGYNIHKGLRREFSGYVTPKGDSFLVSLSEPGDNPFDGKFLLTFDKNFTQATGSWTPVNGKDKSPTWFNLIRTTAMPGEK